MQSVENQLALGTAVVVTERNIRLKGLPITG